MKLPVVLRALQHTLLVIGLAAAGIYGYVWIGTQWLQSRDNQALDRALASKTREKPVDQGIDTGLIGRLKLPRLGVDAVVREGVDSRTLRRAVGRIPGTALPGEPGNIGLAAHRDTFFRALKGVRKDDRIILETLTGTYEYKVDSTTIVSPSNISVLDPTDNPSVTLVTCYPFYYVGKAPKRFIVRGHLVATTQTTTNVADGSKTELSKKRQLPSS
ncbi:MAG: class D sortase [Bryobacteraceae bacterium]|nr:class D sortase [Bryobacterales bacterium]MEB2359786.1 class D sortase [Bryobacterales bacterium]NUM99755.1 class D sortase [Bryobacteraceae bacterium]